MAKNNDSDNTSFFGKLEFLMINVALLWEEELNATERMLMGTILGLYHNSPGGCFASNAYLAQVLNLSNSRTSALLTRLKRKGYIRIDFTREHMTGKVVKRYITPLQFNWVYSDWFDE